MLGRLLVSSHGEMTFARRGANSTVVNIDIGGRGTTWQLVVAIYLPPTVKKLLSAMSLSGYARTHTSTHARTHARTNARTHARTHPMRAQAAPPPPSPHHRRHLRYHLHLHRLRLHRLRLCHRRHRCGVMGCLRCSLLRQLASAALGQRLRFGRP